MECLKAVSDV